VRSSAAYRTAERGTERLAKAPPCSVTDPPAAMRNVAVESGLYDTFRWRGFGWHVVGLER